MTFRLYNTLRRSLDPVRVSAQGPVRMYACGPTTYDVAHAGHGRTAVLCDLIVRHLQASGATVTYVRNITDVDDKILRRAVKEGKNPLELSEFYAGAYQHDMAALGCLPPTHEPKVSQCMGEIVNLVASLLERGHAYAVPSEQGSDVWYAVRKFADYGKLSQRVLDDLRAGEGLEERGKQLHADKHDPLDFALWKSVPADEWGFTSPWGHGRPGWHIECSAMIEHYVGFGFDVHVGGMDLIFPHHENEIAQSEALHAGEGEFCRVWVHGGFLNVDKEKMSKSLGNFVTVRDCLARNDAEAIRYFYLSCHYRHPLEFLTEVLPSGRVVFPSLDEAERRVDFFYQTMGRLAAFEAEPCPLSEWPKKIPPALEKHVQGIRGHETAVTDAMNDDLNTPAALALLQELARSVNELCDGYAKKKKDEAARALTVFALRKASEALGATGQRLGLFLADVTTYLARTQQQRLRLLGKEAAEMEAKIQARREARQAKDFARADALRDELLGWGVEVFDGVAETTWRVVPGGR